MGCPARKTDSIGFKYKEKRKKSNLSIRLVSSKKLIKAEKRQPKYFTYILKWDSGFAPNPFYGFCTLATCKSRIREKAEKGDWIIGLGAKNQNGSKAKNYCGRLVYAMKVTEKITFDQYWRDKRFFKKRPNKKSNKGECGDNIYCKSSNGKWVQAPDSFHNDKHIKGDIKSNFVLISKNFYYHGKKHISIPNSLKTLINKSWQQKGHKILIDQPWRNHKYLDEISGKSLIKWLDKKYRRGIHGKPIGYEETNKQCGTKYLQKNKGCSTSSKSCS